jgi:hypothetical protein
MKKAGAETGCLFGPFIIHHSDFILYPPQTEAPPPFEDGALIQETARTYFVGTVLMV